MPGDKAGYRMVQYGDPVAIGHVIYQRAESGRGQRDGGPARYERQYEGMTAGRWPRFLASAMGARRPPGQCTGRARCFLCQVLVAGNPRVQSCACQHYRPPTASSTAATIPASSTGYLPCQA